MTVDTNAPELLPCPFCGGEAKIYHCMVAFSDVEIGCDPCGFSGPNFGSMEESETALEDATRHWNTRAPHEAAVRKAREVKVKHLVWEDKREGSFAKADTGVYRACNPNGGGFFMWFRYSSWPRSGVMLGIEGNDFDTAFNTLDEAKAAAQADYEWRIREALE